VHTLVYILRPWVYPRIYRATGPKGRARNFLKLTGSKGSEGVHNVWGLREILEKLNFSQKIYYIEDYVPSRGIFDTKFRIFP